jgi:hypothetical protein
MAFIARLRPAVYSTLPVAGFASGRTLSSMRMTEEGERAGRWAARMRWQVSSLLLWKIWRK